MLHIEEQGVNTEFNPSMENKREMKKSSECPVERYYSVNATAG
jgi:hypothetical protein